MLDSKIPNFNFVCAWYNVSLIHAPITVHNWGIVELNQKKLLPEFLFLLVRSPCKISEPYDNPFCGFE